MNLVNSSWETLEGILFYNVAKSQADPSDSFWNIVGTVHLEIFCFNYNMFYIFNFTCLYKKYTYIFSKLH